MDPIIDPFIKNIDKIWERQAFGHVTWGQLVPILFGLAFAFLAWKFIAASSRKPLDNDQSVLARCPECGWQGRVSRFKLECPRCLEQVTPT